MTRNKSSDLSDLPRMVPDRDEIARRRGKTGAPPPPPGGGPQAGGRSGPAVWPLYLLILLLAAGLGYLGYESLEYQVRLQDADAARQSAVERIEELENQLSATDESLILNEGAIQSNFNNITSEIRRLWDVADGRNRDWIRENQQALDNLSGVSDQVASLDDRVGTMTTQLEQVFDELEDEIAGRQTLQADVQAVLESQANLQDAVDTLQDREDEITARLDIVSVRVEGAMELSTDMSQQLNRMDEDLEALTGQLEQEAEARASLSDAVSQLRSRVNLLEDGGISEEFEDLFSRVDAIDIARTDTIQRLSNIQSQISELREQVQALQAE